MTSSVHLLSRGRAFFYFPQYVWDVGYVAICPVIPFSEVGSRLVIDYLLWRTKLKVNRVMLHEL